MSKQQALNGSLFRPFSHGVRFENIALLIEKFQVPKNRSGLK